MRVGSKTGETVAISSSGRHRRQAMALELGQSPRQLAQRRMMATLFPSAPPMQRMVLATAPVPAVDRVIAADIAFQSHRAGGEALSYQQLSSDKKGSHRIESGEWIVVCGHGNRQSMDGVGPAALGSAVKRVDGHEKTGGVYLSACNTATLDQAQTSFLSEFRAQLGGSAQDGGPQVIGATGYKINDFDRVSGEEQVAVPTSKGKRAGELQDEHWLQSGMGGAINQAMGLGSVPALVEAGQKLLQDPKFRGFFKNFVAALQTEKLLEADQLRDQEGSSIDLRGEQALPEA